MRIALLGLPQAGKRTLLALLTGRAVSGARKPGEVIEGVAPVRDPRVDRLAEMFRPRRVTYAENQFVLAPDVVEGATRPWYVSARQCDLLCLVVRAFQAEEVYHPAGSIDARRDEGLLETELVMADLERAMNRLFRIEKEKTRAPSAARAIEERALRKAIEELGAGTALRDLAFGAEEHQALGQLGQATLLPQLRVINVSEEDLGDDWGAGAFALSAQIEREIQELTDPEERGPYLKTLGLADSGLDRMNQAAYDALGLMPFYTVGGDEVRAWTIRRGQTAPEAARCIHSDLARGFIRVEVIKYDDLLAAGSERAVREQGRAQLRGRDYVMEDGDICHFLFNV